MAKRQPKWAMKKAEVAKLKKMVDAEMKRRRAVCKPWTPGSRRKDCVIATAAGPLTIYHEPEYGTIFTRFKHPARANKCNLYPSPNPHSGKWNMHFGSGDTAQRAFNYFKSQLDQVSKKCRGK